MGLLTDGSCNLRLIAGKSQWDFEIPVEQTLRLIEELSADPRKREDYRGLADALRKSAEADNLLTITFRSVRRRRVEFMLWKHLVAALFDQGLGAARCPTCDGWVDAVDLRREGWDTGSAPLEGGGGRRYRCSTSGDVVLDVVDWRA